MGHPLTLKDVPRAQWGDMAKLNEGDRTMEEKLLNDGTITAYGEFENLIHTRVAHISRRLRCVRPPGN
jgi:hypothetical protein